MKQTKQQPRGIRNNNPLNIRIGNVWLGEVQNPTDPHFEQFVSMEYGVRAACVLLRRYIRHYGRKTVPAIIAAWAPSNENNTTRYIDFVCNHAKLAQEQEIEFADKNTICNIVEAMAIYENGMPISRTTIEKGYNMA